MGPYGTTGGPEDARYQAKVCGNHDLNPVRPIGDSWNQIWALRALQVPLGLPKGSFGAKRGPFGGPRGTRMAQRVQIWSQLPPIGLTGFKSWLPHTLAWYLTFLGPKGTRKGPVLAPDVPFGGPRGIRRAPGGQIWS